MVCTSFRGWNKITSHGHLCLFCDITSKEEEMIGLSKETIISHHWDDLKGI